MHSNFVNQRNLIAGFAAFTVAAGVPAVQASVITQDSFPQSSGANLNGAGSGSGWSTNWTKSGSGATVASSGSLGFGSLVTSGNSAEVNVGTRLYRSIDASAYPTALIDANGNIGGDGQSVYVSFTMQTSEVDPDGAGGDDKFYAMRFARDAVGTRVLGVGDVGVDGSIKARINNGAGTEQVLQGTGDTNVHLYVVRFDFDDAVGDTISVFFDPSLASEPTTPDATYTGGDFAFDILSIEAFGDGSFFNGTDEIRIGETYADVTPIPEPGSMALVGLGGLLMLQRRRGSNQA